MKPQYNLMTTTALRHDFCRRVPDLYMDMLNLYLKLERSAVERILVKMDEDDREGLKGPLRSRPPLPPGF
jgi:hypothetical protein